MKKESLIAVLALSVALVGCGKKKNDANSTPTDTSTITAEVSSTGHIKEATKEVKPTKKPFKADYVRKLIVDYGQFPQDFADSLSDDEIKKYYDKAMELTEKTGYRDAKDFIFQELANDYPGKSNKFPLDSIAYKYNRKKSQGDEITDKFYYERQGFIDLGFDQDELAKISDKEIEDAFMASYAANDKGYYDDYVKDAEKILEKNHKSDSKDKDTQTSPEIKDDSNDTQAKDDNKDEQGEKAYDQMREDMVKYYGFDPKVVKKITDEDIDTATERANERLKETGFGDIGLIYDELGKMYPGASTMYPGK